MADFCKKCSIEHFDRDYGDLADLGFPKKAKPGKGWAAICEGCQHDGGCIVDDSGLCLIREELEKAGKYPEWDKIKVAP